MYLSIVLALFGVAPLLIYAILRQRPNHEVGSRRESLPIDESNGAPLQEIGDQPTSISSGRYKECLIFFICYLFTIAVMSCYLSVDNGQYKPTLEKSRIAANNCIPPTGKQLLNAYGGPITYHEFPIVTSSSITQVLFTQGLLHLYGFNQIEAVRNFQAAIQFDELCAMCYWGIAAANGPNINDIMTPSKYAIGYDAIRTARRLVLDRSFGGTEGQNVADIPVLPPPHIELAIDDLTPDMCANKEKLLIVAMSHRFSMSMQDLSQTGTSYGTLEGNYSLALARILNTCGGTDRDIVTFYAESLLHMSPWQYFIPLQRGEGGSPLGSVDRLTPSAAMAYDILQRVIFDWNVSSSGGEGTAGGDRSMGKMERDMNRNMDGVDDDNMNAQGEVMKNSNDNMSNGRSVDYKMANSMATETSHTPHPLALHLYIHITEQLVDPAGGRTRGNVAADMLHAQAIGPLAHGATPFSSASTGGGRDNWSNTRHTTPVAFAVGHLLHMPAHMYLRLGRYSDCISTSAIAIQADEFYQKSCLVPYFPSHNKALLIMCATYAGKEEFALEYSTTLAAEMSDTVATKYMMSLVPLPQVRLLRPTALIVWYDRTNLLWVVWPQHQKLECVEGRNH